MRREETTKLNQSIHTLRERERENDSIEQNKNTRHFTAATLQIIDDTFH